jgi:hypothetical protein
VGCHNTIEGENTGKTKERHVNNNFANNNNKCDIVAVLDYVKNE